MYLLMFFSNLFLLYRMHHITLQISKQVKTMSFDTAGYNQSFVTFAFKVLIVQNNKRSWIETRTRDLCGVLLLISGGLSNP